MLALEFSPDLKPVWTKAFAGDPGRQLMDGNKLAAGNLFGLEVKWAVVRHVINHAEGDAVLAIVAEGEEWQRPKFNADLLAAFAQRRFVERLARGDDAAYGQIPVRRK